MKKNEFMTAENDTIAAICTAPGGALAILRISGSSALTVLNRLCFGKKQITRKDARKAILTHILAPQGECCLAIFMPGPASYTGEDVAEIQCHGGGFAPARLLRAALNSGARPAEGGEFTRRAFLNGKLDLTQAEAVADLISAKSRAAGILAEHQMSGSLGNGIRACREPMIQILAEIESRMDFPEEELDWQLPLALLEKLRSVEQNLEKLLGTARTGSLLRDGIRLVIAGTPNVGKSSLLNALLGFERAIVTDLPGTTRDTLEETLSIGGVALRATDTAGLREGMDAAEKLGIERTRKSMAAADLVVWLLDASRPDAYEEEIAKFRAERPQGIPVILCWNKADLPHPSGLPPIPEVPTAPVLLSAADGTGLEELRTRIESEVWKNADRSESEYAVAERHAALLRETLEEIRRAETEIPRENWELAASSLHNAVQDLGTVTGENASPDILDEIFARFCIGK